MRFLKNHEIKQLEKLFNSKNQESITLGLHILKGKKDYFLYDWITFIAKCIIFIIIGIFILNVGNNFITNAFALHCFGSFIVICFVILLIYITAGFADLIEERKKDVK